MGKYVSRVEARASYVRPCSVCDRLISKGAQIVLRKGAWVHAGCVNGADD